MKNTKLLGWLGIALFFCASTCAAADGKGVPAINILEGRIITKHGLFILFTTEGKGYALKLEKAFPEIIAHVDTDADVRVSVKETKDIRAFKNTRVSKNGRKTISQEEYRVVIVEALLAVTSPSKVTQADIDKTVTVESSGSLSGKSGIVLTPTEIEGTIAAINRKLLPMIIEVVGQDGRRVSIAVPGLAGVFKDSQNVGIDVLAVGDQVDVWYQGSDKKVAEMISIVK